MGAAFAQDTAKNQLALLLGAENIPGRTTAAGQDLTFSKSPVFSANYARHLFGERTALYLEFPFAAAPRHDIQNNQTGVIANLATLYVTPSLRLQFASHSALYPWVSGGFGYGEYEGSQRLQGGATNPDRRQSVGTAQFGAGVDIRTPIHLLLPIGLRAEVRDYYSISAPGFGIPVDSDSQHNVVVAGGIVLQF
jgi:hypothetical protein